MSNGIIMLSAAEQVSMADEWFEFAKADHFWMQWRFSVILKALEKLNLLRSELKYMEVGCGHGQFLKQFESTINCSIDGSDLNLFAIQQIQNIKGTLMVYNIHEKHKNLIGQYDVIFLLDVIEHIENDKAFLESTCAHLRLGGYIVINVPALNFLFSKYDLAAGHKRRYSKKDIRRVLNDCGLEVIEIQYWGFSLLPILLIRKFILMFVKMANVINVGFSAKSSFINKLFKIIMSMETYLVKDPILGSSLICVGRVNRTA